jgi:hypothetical protein
MFERRGAESPTRSGRLFKHEMDVIEDEIGEALLRPIEPDAETEHAAVEIQRAGEITDVKFGDEARHCHRRVQSREKAARDLVSRDYLRVPLDGQAPEAYSAAIRVDSPRVTRS